MASMGELPVDTSIRDDAQADLSRQSPEDPTLKRKASPKAARHDDSPKRIKREDEPEPDDGEVRVKTESRSPERDRRASEASGERRQSAVQEEKKRSRRLFGGLLNTLSQAPGNSQQQKRRLEIEKRQQERMQRQDVEDGQKRAERLAKVRRTRLAEQIVFDEEVMNRRHEKMLSLARFLQTRARPRIYYLPWKCTVKQEDSIYEQLDRAKATVAREKEEFERRRERHIAKYGTDGRSRPRAKSPETARIRETAPVEKSASPKAEEEGPAKKAESPKAPAATGISAHTEPTPVDRHDDAGDVMEEGEEDTVIY